MLQRNLLRVSLIAGCFNMILKPASKISALCNPSRFCKQPLTSVIFYYFNNGAQMYEQFYRLVDSIGLWSRLWLALSSEYLCVFSLHGAVTIPSCNWRWSPQASHQPGIQQTLRDHGYRLAYHAICLFTPPAFVGYLFQPNRRGRAQAE